MSHSDLSVLAARAYMSAGSLRASSVVPSSENASSMMAAIVGRRGDELPNERVSTTDTGDCLCAGGTGGWRFHWLR